MKSGARCWQNRRDLRLAQGLTTKVLEEEVTDIRRSNTTKFQVTGDEYNANGRVTAWRTSVMRGKEELVSKASFLWN